MDVCKSRLKRHYLYKLVHSLKINVSKSNITWGSKLVGQRVLKKCHILFEEKKLKILQRSNVWLKKLQLMFTNDFGHSAFWLKDTKWTGGHLGNGITKRAVRRGQFEKDNLERTTWKGQLGKGNLEKTT